MNVASLSGIYRYALGMPDMHQGFGFPAGHLELEEPFEQYGQPVLFQGDIKRGSYFLVDTD
ncbi:RtcB family protein [Gracilinema caldarium]|uniref:RtcB family protein n=1 Tax=Gracilinema caldarium TaxID=215591 RepID=UPI00031D888C|nr:RtcB family protein [Gracilinema caldarium]